MGLSKDMAYIDIPQKITLHHHIPHWGGKKEHTLHVWHIPHQQMQMSAAIDQGIVHEQLARSKAIEHRHGGGLVQATACLSSCDGGHGERCSRAKRCGSLLGQHEDEYGEYDNDLLDLYPMFTQSQVMPQCKLMDCDEFEVLVRFAGLRLLVTAWNNQIDSIKG